MHGSASDHLCEVASAHAGEAHVVALGVADGETVLAIIRCELTVANVVDEQVFGELSGVACALLFAKEIADVLQLLLCGARVVEEIEHVVSAQSKAIVGKEVGEECFDGAREGAPST